jgi:hypothetical protein
VNYASAPIFNNRRRSRARRELIKVGLFEVTVVDGCEGHRGGGRAVSCDGESNGEGNDMISVESVSMSQSADQPLPVIQSRRK